MPSTATMAAIPMATPSADRPARSRRARRPTVPTGSRSPGRSRDSRVGGWVLLMGVDLPIRMRVGHDLPVAQLDLADHRGGDLGVVGDHHQGGALAVELLQQDDEVGGGGRVEVAGGFVGQHHLRVADQRRGDRHRAALPPDRALGRWCSRWSSPTRSRARRASRRRSGPGMPR